MKRRNFLGLGAASAAVASWPAWLAHAFDPESAACTADQRVEHLFDSYRAARRGGKPLLILMIPDADDQKWERGAMWGRVLNHGSEETLAALALMSLSCATAAELSRLVALDAAQDATFVTIDTTQLPARTRTYQVALAEPPQWSGDNRETYETWEADLDRAIDAQIAQLGAALGRAISETLADTPPPAADFTAERVARAILGGEEVVSAEVLRVARALHERAAAAPAERDRLIAALAVAVRAEVISKPLSGSHWGLSSGCGTTIEDQASDEQVQYACGMGHVPAKSARFLYFFAKLPGEG